MDYSKLSDFEINILVAKEGGHGPLDKEKGWAGSQKEPFTAVIVKGAHILGAFDPCNNPADAWPIIQNSGISLVYDGDDWLALHFSRTSLTYSNDNRKHPDKPFRAALILWLMMKESE